MADKKIITIFGATGSQGGAVAHSLVANKTPGFKVRGITRDPSSEKAQALAKAGVELIKADAWNPGEVRKALEGSWGVFLNTPSDDPKLYGGDVSEIDFGKSLVDAAQEAGVKHVVYSSLPIYEPLEAKEIDPEAFKEKHRIQQYIFSHEAFDTATGVIAGWYLENFLPADYAALWNHFPHPASADATGVHVWKTPLWGHASDAPFGYIGIQSDFGDIVHGIYLTPQKYNRKTVQAASIVATNQEIVEAFEKGTGKKARLEALKSWEDFETYGVPIAEETKKIYRAVQLADGKGTGVPYTTGDARVLKVAAVQSKGAEDGELVKLEEFFEKYFS